MKRHSALALVAIIGLAGPTLLPLPALAQADEPGMDGSGSYAKPPPVDSSMKPGGEDGPDKKYKHETECVEQNLEYNEDIQNAPWGQQYLRIDEVHALMRSTTNHVGAYPDGEPVKVAVIDTGVTEHPYLGARLEGGGDFVKKSDTGLEDCDGHGTQVAGIIAAGTPENIGFTGVAPEAEILSIRQSSQNYTPEEDSGSASGGSRHGGQRPGDTGPSQDTRTQNSEGAGTLTTLAKAIVRAADSGVDVMNVSINHCRPAMGPITADEQTLQAAIDYAVNTKDVVVVSAAGNASDGNNCAQNDQTLAENPTTIVTPPWFSDDVISVAAIDETGGVADFSMHGPWISVAAPGTDIISLDPAKGSDGLANMFVNNGEPDVIKGTSFAAPYVAGLAALVRAKYQNLDAHGVKHRIEYTAQHPAAPGGRDNFVGHGVINPMAALSATVPSEQGMPSMQAEDLPSDMPPPGDNDMTPTIVALAGAGGALVALGITLFVVHTIRRNRNEEAKPARL